MSTDKETIKHPVKLGEILGSEDNTEGPLMMAKPEGEECRHIIGIALRLGNAWVVFKKSDLSELNADIYFKFCPLCGEKLNVN